MTLDIGRLTAEEKLGLALRRALPMLPEELRGHVSALLNPKSLALMAGVTGVWAASHFLGIGALIDVVLVVVGVAAFGQVAVDVAASLVKFARKTLRAETEDDIDEAAKHFAHAVTIGGITLVMSTPVPATTAAGIRRPYPDATAQRSQIFPAQPATGDGKAGSAGGHGVHQYAR